MREYVPLLLLCALIGCTSTSPSPTSTPGVTLHVAPQFLGSCNEQASTQGDNQFPPGVERVKIRVLDGATVVAEKSVTKSDQTKTGEIVLTGVPSGKPLRVEVFGCEGAGSRVLWSGAIDAVQVAQFGKVTPEIFVTKRDSFNCTGSQATVSGRPMGSSLLPVGVAFQSTTLLPNGLVLIAGGTTGYLKDSRSHETTDHAALYYPHIGVFEHLDKTMVSRRAFHSAVSFKLNGEEVVLLVGGLGKATYANINAEFPVTPTGTPAEFQVTPIEVFHLPSKSFVPLNGVDIPWRLFAAVATDADRTTLIVAGGVSDQGVATDDLFIWNGSSLVHSKLRARRAGHSIVRLSDGAFLIWGGNIDGNKLHMGELLLPGAQTTTLVKLNNPNSLPDPHALHSFSLVNDRFVVIGGNPISGKVLRNAVANAYLLDFNASSNSVTATPLTPTSTGLAQRAFHTVAVVGKNLYVVGGQSQLYLEELTPPTVVGKVNIEGNTATFDALITVSSGAIVSFPTSSIGMTSVALTDGSIAFFGGMVTRADNNQLLDLAYIWSTPISTPASCD